MMHLEGVYNNLKTMKKLQAIYLIIVFTFIVILLSNVPSEKERIKHLPINVKLK